MSAMIRTLRVASITCLVLCLGASPVAAQTDPSVAGQWASLAPLPIYPTALHLLPTGMVMFYSGYEAGADPLLWDPATATTTVLPKPGYDLFCSGHAFLADGRLFFAGGHIADNVGLPNASMYDATSNVWEPGPDMNAGRWYPTVTTLANGDVLVFSGNIDTLVGVNPLPQVFQVASGTWRDLTNAQLKQYLYPRMHLAPNGKVFMAAPSSITRYLDTSGTGAWTEVATRTYGARDYGSSVMYDDGKVLVMGGGDLPPTNTAEVIDLYAPSPSWRAVESMAFARRQLNATLLPDGKVLVTGGTSGPGFNNALTPVYAAEMWDPATERWTTMASAKTPRLYHSAALLLTDGRVLTAGGDDYPQVEVYSPPYLFAGARPTITSAPPAVSYGQSFFVETPEAASIAKVTWIRLGSVTHAFDENQRINSLSFSPAPGGLDVVPPSNANLAPPGHYMLFILDSNGVPSVAKIVRVDLSPPPVDTTPPVITDVTASYITASAATINWSTNEPADSQVEYGPTSAYGSSTTLNTALFTSHSQTVSGLTANTLYHYRAKSQDAAGNTAVSPDQTFTTHPRTTRSEESAASYTVSWTTYGPETGTFSGGTMVASNTVGATATFSFTGTSVSWIGVRCNVCGIAAVSIDGGLPTTVNTFGPAATGSLTSEVVFSASGFAPGVTHTMVITVTGTTTSPALFGGTLIAVDAFDVTR